MRRITLAALLLTAALGAAGPPIALSQHPQDPQEAAEPRDRPQPAEARTEAQGPPEPLAERPAGDADREVEVDPATGERWRWVRPTDDMRRGLLPVSTGVAVAAGALLGVAAAVALVLRYRRARRRRR